MSASPDSKPRRALVGGLIRCVSSAAAWISGISFAGMLAIVLVSIALRLLEIPFFWGEEAARYLMFAGIYIGMSVAVRERAHLGVDMFVRLFPAGVARALRLLAAVATTVVYVAITKVCWDFTARMARGKQISPALSIPMYLLYGIIFVGFALCCLESALIVWKDFFAPPDAAGQTDGLEKEEVHLL